MNFFIRTGNFFVKILLRSSLHGIISRNTLLISYTGRKSGKSFTIPTNYSQEGNTVRIVSFKDRVWWRNLRGGAPVTLQIKGKSVLGRVEVFMDNASVANGLKAYLQTIPEFAKYFNVRIDDKGKPNEKDINQAAKYRVIVEVSIER
jgi:hypothetical protein